MFLSSTHETFSKTDHVLQHRTRFNIFKEYEKHIKYLLEHSETKLEINSRKKRGKSINTWKLNNLLLNNPGSKKKKSQKNLENIWDK